MPLITVYFELPGEDYAKAIIDVRKKDFFMSMGAVLTQQEAEFGTRIPDEEPEPTEPEEAPDPDKGFGKPGDVQWHEVQLASFGSRIQITEYVKEVTGQDFTITEKSAKKIRKEALSVIKEHLSNDNES